MTLLTSAPRKVMCVCLQPWPPFLPHRAAPWAPCFLTNTWSVPECSPVTLCLNDRHRSPECRRWPRGSSRRAARPAGPLAAETVRYCPPAGSLTGSQCKSLSFSRIHPQSPWSKLQLCIRTPGSSFASSSALTPLSISNTSNKSFEGCRGTARERCILFPCCIDKEALHLTMGLGGRTQALHSSKESKMFHYISHEDS